ncbi:MAG: YbbR-like domain-containing protein [Oscillospiraceae bacterium]
MKSKLPALLLSLVVAMGLWLYVVTSVSPESDQIYSGIPVVFENETSLLDRELMLVSGENATVSVRLYGKRANLNRLNASNIIVTVDLRAVTEPGKYELEYKVSYPSGITNVSLDKRVTPTVSVEAVRFEEKDVPVKLVFQGKQEEGLILDQEQAVLSASTVHVSGAKDEVDQVAMAGIVIDRTGLRENLVGDFVYTLMDQNSQPVDVPMCRRIPGKFTWSCRWSTSRKSPCGWSWWTAAAPGQISMRSAKLNRKPSTFPALRRR